MPHFTHPPYDLDELYTRATEGSIDINRLAATVGQMLQTVTALAEWANSQIQQTQQAAVAPESAEPKRKR